MSDAEIKVADAHTPAQPESLSTPVHVPGADAAPVPAITVANAAKPLAPTDLALFAELLVGLVRARMPLPDALKLLAKDADTPRLKVALEGVERDVAAGTPLAEALRKRDGEFPRLFTALIEQGVHANDLHAALVELVREYRSQQRFREALWSQLLSPLATAFFLGTFILVIVLSQIGNFYREVYKEMRVDLPLPTRFVLALNDLFHNPLTGAIAAIGTILIGILCVRVSRRTSSRRNFQMFTLSLPVIGPFLKTTLLARFSRILAILLLRRIPLDVSLKLARDSFTFLPMQAAVDAVLRRVENGASFDEALTACPVFTPTLIQFVRGGQLHGDMPATLSRVADLYEQRSEIDGARLRNMIFLVAQISVGVLVGLLLLSYFLPLFRIQDVLRKK